MRLLVKQRLTRGERQIRNCMKIVKGSVCSSQSKKNLSFHFIRRTIQPWTWHLRTKLAIFPSLLKIFDVKTVFNMWKQSKHTCALNQGCAFRSVTPPLSQTPPLALAQCLDQALAQAPASAITLAGNCSTLLTSDKVMIHTSTALLHFSQSSLLKLISLVVRTPPLLSRLCCQKKT